MGDTSIKIEPALAIVVMAALFAAITDFFDGSWLTAAWIAFSGGFSIIGSRGRSAKTVAVSVPLWTASLYRLFLLEGHPPHYMPVINSRFALFILAALLLAATHAVCKGRKLRSFMKGFAFAAALAVILGSLKEVRDFVVDPHLRNLSYSYVLAGYSAAFLAAGFLRRSATLRAGGIALAVLVVLKLYLYDIWAMSILVRIIAGFTLGLALLSLSLFYQRFRDRLFPGKGAVPVLTFIILSLSLTAQVPGSTLSAAEFRAGGWRYYKAIEWPERRTGPLHASAYGSILLDEDMIRHGGSDELRIAWGGALLPHFVRPVVEASAQRGFRSPAVIFQERTRDGAVYVLRLPEPPAGCEYIELELKGDGMFEAGMQISTGTGPGRWGESSHRSVFSYAGESQSRIRFQSGDRRFLRLSLDKPLKLSFPKIHFASIQQQAEHLLPIPLAQMAREREIDRGGTSYYYQNVPRRKIGRLVLRFSDARYRRATEIYFFDRRSKEYRFAGTAVLSRRSGDVPDQVVDFPEPATDAFKLLLLDGDNPPLTLSSAEAYLPIEEAIFTLQAPEETDAGPEGALKVYYGNPYASRPDYDIFQTFDPQLGVVRLKAGDHTVNESFAYSLAEPPVSTWIIRLLFIAGLIALSYPAWRILGEYAKIDGSREDGGGPASPPGV